MLGPVTRLRKFKSLSPLSSPQTSPVTSPKSTKRKFGICSPKFKKKDHEHLGLFASSPSAHEKMVKELGSQEVDLNHIQNLFPFDNLLLSVKDPCALRKKTLCQKRSTTTAKLQRALSGKSKVSPTERTGKTKNKDGFCNSSDNSKPYRKFILESSVQLTVGVQSQARHLFLFTDLLLIAKARSSGTYKLKEQVRVSEVWFGSRLEEVCEVTLLPDTSFVIGWPTTNVVATFSSPHTKNLWITKLKQMIAEEMSKEPKTTSIQVMHCLHDGNGEEQCKRLSIACDDTAEECLIKVLHSFNKQNIQDYQLWVKTFGDEAPYPLIGHERPFAIKMNCIRAVLPNNDNSSYSNSSVGSCRCIFILRDIRKPQFTSSGFSEISRKGKFSKKSQIVNKMFRRSASKPDSLDVQDCQIPRGQLFGHSLTAVCKDNNLPKPIMDILIQLFRKGPFTHGIFRKSANSKCCKELREKLDAAIYCDVESVNILILASVIKEFFRSLPDCLLMCHLYDEWLEVPRYQNDCSKLRKVIRLLGKIPKPNLILLKHFLCVLRHIAQRNIENQMTASNLAVCVGPSLLWSNNSSTNPETTKQIPLLIEFMIESCTSIFGEEVLWIFGGSSQKEMSRQDSGAEESDSLHSSGGLRRDDSSIDSLEHALLGENDSSPKLPNKTKMSLTNLSRDSGLTLSDSQLYTPDEEDEKNSNTSHLTNKEFQTETQSCSFSEPLPNRDLNSSKGVPMYNRTISACEISSRDLKALRRSQIPFENAKPKETEKYKASRAKAEKEQEKNKIVKELPKPQMSFPLNYRKEVHKRRLSRPRQWYNPSTPWDPDDMSPNATLRKSASEESLLSSCKPIERNNLYKRENSSMKPSLVKNLASSQHSNISLFPYSESPRMYRSKSVHHLLAEERVPQQNSTLYSSSNNETLITWHRTQSTPHLDDLEGSYDSSTLSDDDSTPHISRSNSRGKDYAGNDCTPNHVDLYSSISSHSKDQSQIFAMDDSHSSENSYSLPNFNSGHYPPSYEETISRQTLLRKSNLNLNWDYDQMQEEHTYVNIPLRQNLETPVRMNSDHITELRGEIHYATPICVDSEDDCEPPPPLPPKPRSSPSKSDIVRVETSSKSTPKVHNKKESELFFRRLHNIDGFNISLGAESSYQLDYADVKSLPVHLSSSLPSYNEVPKELGGKESLYDFPAIRTQLQHYTAASKSSFNRSNNCLEKAVQPEKCNNAQVFSINTKDNGSTGSHSDSSSTTSGSSSGTDCPMKVQAYSDYGGKIQNKSSLCKYRVSPSRILLLNKTQDSKTLWDEQKKSGSTSLTSYIEESYV